MRNLVLQDLLFTLLYFAWDVTAQKSPRIYFCKSLLALYFKLTLPFPPLYSILYLFISSQVLSLFLSLSFFFSLLLCHALLNSNYLSAMSLPFLHSPSICYYLSKFGFLLSTLFFLCQYIPVYYIFFSFSL